MQPRGGELRTKDGQLFLVQFWGVGDYGSMIYECYDPDEYKDKPNFVGYMGIHPKLGMTRSPVKSPAKVAQRMKARDFALSREKYA